MLSSLRQGDDMKHIDLENAARGTRCTRCDGLWRSARVRLFDANHRQDGERLRCARLAASLGDSRCKNLAGGSRCIAVD